LLQEFISNHIPRFSLQEEMDLKTLQFQNKKLWERIEVRRQAEAELMEQIETMQAKQTKTDATLSLVNRYWDQVTHQPRS